MNSHVVVLICGNAEDVPVSSSECGASHHDTGMRFDCGRSGKRETLSDGFPKGDEPVPLVEIIERNF